MVWPAFSNSLPRQYMHLLGTVFLGITAKSIHAASSVLLIRQLAYQSHDSDDSDDQDDDALKVLFVRWDTVILAIGAFTSVICVPLYSTAAPRWGGQKLMILGFGSMAVYELCYAFVAWRSFHCNSAALDLSKACRPEQLWAILVGLAAMAGILGGDEVIQLAARIICVDESTVETRARRINYLQAVAMAAYTFGAVIASLLGQGDVRLEDLQDYSQVFSVASAMYVGGLIYLLVFLRVRPQVSQQIRISSSETSIDGAQRMAEENNSSRGLFQRFRAVVCLEPKGNNIQLDDLPYLSRLLPPMRRLPIIKILICSVLSIDGQSVFHSMLQFGDIRFSWQTEQNSRLLAFSSFARFLSIFFLVPYALKWVANILRRRLAKPRMSVVISVASEERQTLLMPLDEAHLTSVMNASSSKYASPEPWVALLSFVTSTIGWLLVALSTVLASVKLLVAAIFVLAQGSGGYTMVTTYAINELEKCQEASRNTSSSDDGQDQDSTLIQDRLTIKGDGSSLAAYLGVLGMLENVMSLIAPLLDGAIFSATLSLAPYAVFVWAALQYTVCCAIILWL